METLSFKAMPAKITKTLLCPVLHHEMCLILFLYINNNNINNNNIHSYIAFLLVIQNALQSVNT